MRERAYAGRLIVAARGGKRFIREGEIELLSCHGGVLATDNRAYGSVCFDYRGQTFILSVPLEAVIAMLRDHGFAFHVRQDELRGSP